MRRKWTYEIGLGYESILRDGVMVNKEQAVRALNNYESHIAELEALVDELVDSGDNLFDSLNPIAWKHEWLDKWWKLSSCRRGEREKNG